MHRFTSKETHQNEAIIYFRASGEVVYKPDPMAHVLRRLSGFGMQKTNHPCTKCGEGLWKSECPVHACDGGEIHEDDFSATACEMCEGSGIHWWCGNTECDE